MTAQRARQTGAGLVWRGATRAALALACSALALAGGCVTAGGEERVFEPYTTLTAPQRDSLRQAYEALQAAAFAQAEAAARKVTDAARDRAVTDGTTADPGLRSPGLSMANVLLALAQSGQGRQAEAMQTFGAALRADPENAVARFDLGNLLLRLKRDDDAVVQFREVVRLQPRHQGAWLNLAVAQANCHHLPQAESALKRLLALEPHSAEAHNLRGTILLDQGLVLDAVAEFKSAIALKPMREDFHLNLARSFELIDRKLDADGEYHRFLELAPAGDPDRAGVQQALQRQAP